MRRRRKPMPKAQDAEEKALRAAEEGAFIPVGHSLTMRDVQLLDKRLLARLMAGMMAMGTCTVTAADIHANLDDDSRELVRDLLPGALRLLLEWEEVL